MKKRHLKYGHIYRLFAFGALLGMLLFVMIYGFRVLDPTYDDWLLAAGEDLTQHYFGWKFLRNSSWHFPLGLIEKISASGDVSAVFLDCIPIVGLFFKLLSPILPETFQYIGLWALFCFGMMGGTSAVLLHRFCKSNIFCLLGSIVFTVSPTVIQRLFHHEALAAQWIVVLAIAFWAYREHQWKYRNTPIILWSVLGALAVTIHLYFIPMIYTVMFGYIMTDILKTRKIKRSLLCFASTTVCTAVTMFVFGVFHGSSDMEAGGLGKYSSNYNALFNSMGNSDFLKPLDYFEGQRGGFGYMGLGMIAVGAAAFIIALWHFVKRVRSSHDFKSILGETFKTALPVIIVLTLAMFAAASPKGTLNKTVIYEINYPAEIVHILKIFRASGRFIWVDLYLLYTLIFAALSRIKKKNLMIAAAALCVSMQMLDLRGYIEKKHDKFTAEVVYKNEIAYADFMQAAEGAERIVFLPVPENFLHYKKMYYSFGEYACDLDLEMNVFYTARQDYKMLKSTSEEEYDKLVNGQGDADALYVFFDESDLPSDTSRIKLYKLGQYTAARFLK